MAGIFINYRRDDAPGVAGRLGDRLSKTFSHREIFMDVDAMKPGLDFVKQLDEQVSKCNVLLAVIGPSWLNAADEKGRRKLELPRDYVRIELASALKREIPVIPLLVNGAVMPSEDDLPDDLKSLANRHALELRHTRFAADSETIVKALNVILPRRTKWRRIAAGGGLALACVLAGLALWTGQNEHYALRLSDIFQTSPPAKPAAAPETRTEVSNAASAPKPPSSSTTSTPVIASTQTLSTAPSGRPAPAGDYGDRIALVIGNAKYPDADAPLKEPINDARDVADELKRDGFNVEVGENLNGDGMRRALDKLYGRIKPGSVALVFFSGFGVQSGRQSYMIPVDAQIWTEPDVRRDGFSLETILGEINNRGAGVKIALIDASRRNPFERRFRNFSAGLAPVIAPNGTLVMYSTALSSIISDNGGDHSLFVQELLKQIRVPDLMAEETLNRTRVGVTRASRSEQVPWISSSLARDFSFNPATQTAR
jgi:Caspase domain/TIR domain